MKKRIRWKISLLLILWLVNVAPLSVRAEDYFSAHKDWKEYCLRAHDATITTDTLQQWLSSGQLGQAAAAKCQLTVKTGPPTIDFEDWGMYTGAMTADTKALADLSGTKETAQAAVRFYINDSEGEQEYLTVTVTVLPVAGSGGADLPNTPTPSDSVDNGLDGGDNGPIESGSQEIQVEGSPRIEQEQSNRQQNDTNEQDNMIKQDPVNGQDNTIKQDNTVMIINGTASQGSVPDIEQEDKELPFEGTAPAGVKVKTVTMFAALCIGGGFILMVLYARSIWSDLCVLWKYRRKVKEG